MPYLCDRFVGRRVPLKPEPLNISPVRYPRPVQVYVCRFQTSGRDKKKTIYQRMNVQSWFFPTSNCIHTHAENMCTINNAKRKLAAYTFLSMILSYRFFFTQKIADKVARAGVTGGEYPERVLLIIATVFALTRLCYVSCHCRVWIRRVKFSLLNRSVSACPPARVLQ